MQIIFNNKPKNLEGIEELAQAQIEKLQNFEDRI